MPANTAPIFPLTPKVSWGTITAKNTAKDGTGTVVTLFTAGSNGSRVDYVKSKALGTNTATVLRLFINNGSDTTVAANNTLFAELTIAATTLSETSQLLETNIITLGFSLPAGYKITATVGSDTATFTGLQLTCIGGDY